MKKTFFGIAVLSIFSFLFGCGTAEYERRMKERGLKGLSSGSKFNALGAETKLPGTEVFLRLPTVGSPPAMQPVDINDPRRGKCALIDIPGLTATYEGAVEDAAKNEQHFYLYVGVKDLAAMNNYIPTKIWLGDLQTKYPEGAAAGSTEVNKNFSADTPEGRVVKWEEFHYQCPQEFFYPTKVNPQNYQKMPGTVVCLCRAENGTVVTLVFRYPSSFADRHSTDFDSDWIKLVAGCLKVQAPAAN